MLAPLLLGTALASPLPSIELGGGVGFATTSGAIDSEGFREDEENQLQLAGPALSARASLALKRGRWWQFQGVLGGWWIPLPVERQDGDAPEAAPEADPTVVALSAGAALAAHPGPRIRLNGGVSVVGMNMRTSASNLNHTRVGVGWELNAYWIWNVGPKWAVGLGIGLSGHAVPRMGPDKSLFTGGEGGLRVVFIQDGMKKKWHGPVERIGDRIPSREG